MRSAVSRVRANKAQQFGRSRGKVMCQISLNAMLAIEKNATIRIAGKKAGTLQTEQTFSRKGRTHCSCGRPANVENAWCGESPSDGTARSTWAAPEPKAQRIRAEAEEELPLRSAIGT
jgi:hypothetical protein